MFFNATNIIISKIAILLIKIYQTTISPDHGVFRYAISSWGCLHYPSCSEYVKTVFEKDGFMKGFKKGAKRIISCH